MTSDVHQDIHTSPIDCIPREVVELILSKCPVKSVVRFKSVSKSWESIISTPLFSRILQSKLPDNLRNKFFMWERRRPAWGCFKVAYLEEDGNLQREAVLGYPSSKLVPLWSCNGLILLVKYFPSEYMVWNPLIKKHITIPSFNPDTHPQAFRNRPPEQHYYFNVQDSSDRAQLHYFYYDSTVDDHKIVAIYENCYTIYSCRNKCWEVKYFPAHLFFSYSDPCSDGCFYLDWENDIEYLDTRDGKEGRLRKPDEVKSLINVELREVSGRLCLHGFSEDRRRLQLWELEKNGRLGNSWRKLISMEKEEANLFNLWPIYLSSDDLVVLHCMVGDEENGIKIEYFVYNPRENSFKKDDFDWRNGRCFTYSETLYMPSSDV